MNPRTRLSWGRYPQHPQTVHPVQWPSEVDGAVAAAREAAPGGTLAFGMGRSYGDSCMAESDHVVATAGFDRVISADWGTGTIEITRLLAISQPRSALSVFVAQSRANT